MKKILALIITLIFLLTAGPFQVYAAGSNKAQAADTADVVSLISPPNGLKAAKGNGTDETSVIQAIFDYAIDHNKAILIPEGYTFIVDGLFIEEKSGFTILGYGTLKHKDNASDGILTIDKSSNFTIKAFTTDGNVEGNKTNGERINEYLYSLGIYRSSNFKIAAVNDINPAGDSVYLNDVKDVTIGTIHGKADKACGRNALSIIKAQNVTIDRVVSINIGHPTMPGGIDLEPNRPTDNIQNVVIKSADIKTSANYGLAVGNGARAVVKDIEINANVTRFGNPESSVFVLQNVENFKGNITINQEGNVLCIGASITGSKNVNANLQITNATLGIELGKKSSDINLKGKIAGVTRGGVSTWEGVSTSSINMEVNGKNYTKIF